MRARNWICLLLTLCLLAGVVPAGLAEEEAPELEIVEASVSEWELELSEGLVGAFPEDVAGEALLNAAAASDGWRKIDGGWYYYVGGAPVTGWRLVDGSWYRLGDDGRMLTGWQRDGSSWYYLKSSGAIAEGWLQLDGVWYYFAPGSGHMVTGWRLVGGQWYYFDPTNNSGKMVTGWRRIGGTWYYFTSGGSMAEGWKLVDGSWYYFIPGSGAMAANRWRLIDAHWYYFDADGAMVTGWQQIDRYTYYFNSSGEMAEGWRCPDGDNMKWYYFIPGSGEMAMNRWRLINNRWYHFDENGVMALDWEDIDGKRYYFGCDGVMVAGRWYSDSYGTWYFLPTGEMAVGTHEIDGEVYTFDENGRVISIASAEPTANTLDLAFVLDLNSQERCDKLESMGWHISIETREDGTLSYCAYNGAQMYSTPLRVSWNDDENAPYFSFYIRGTSNPAWSYSLAGVTPNMSFYQAIAALEKAGWTYEYIPNPEYSSIECYRITYTITRSGNVYVYEIITQNTTRIDYAYMYIQRPVKEQFYD